MPSAITYVSPILIVCSVFGNVLTICAVLKTRALRCRYAVLLTTNLAVCDLSFSVFSCPVNFITTLLDMQQLETTVCRVNGFIGVLLCLTSLLTLTAVSFDRYIAIVKPFRYNIWMTYTRIKIIIVSIWVFASMVAVIPLSGWGMYIFYPRKGFCFIDYHKDISAFFFIAIWFQLGLGLITFSYWHIFKEARRQKRQIQSLNIPSVPSQDDATVKGHGSHQRSHLRKVKQENKAALTIFVLVGGFLTCWMPFVFVNLGSALFKYEIPRSLDVISTLLVGCGACVNPLFYAWLDASFRMAFKRILHPIFQRIGSAPVTIVSQYSATQK